MISSEFLKLGSMGALTFNRKLSEDHHRPINKFPPFNSTDSGHHTNTHISKKVKTSPLMRRRQEPSVSSGGAVSRLSRYPPPVNRIPREVHAPCRPTRFGFRESWSGEWRPKEEDSGGFRENSSGESRPKEEDSGGFRESSIRESRPKEEDSGGEMGSFMSRLARYDKTRKDFIESLQLSRKSKKDVEDESCIEVVEVAEDSRRLQHYSPPLAGKGVERNSMLSSRKNGNLRVEDEFDSLSLTQEQGDSDLLVHKELLQSANRRNYKLGRLNIEIEQSENRLSSLRRQKPVKKPEKEDVLEAALGEAFKPLTREELADVARAFSSSNRRKVLAAHEKSNIEITGEVMRCLLPGGWLNDEVINLYLALLKEREKREPKKFLKCHFFNTFFYKKLVGGTSGYDFKSVRRWTTQRKLGYLLFDCDKIFVPIHKGNHWCLAVINKKDKKFQYLDSLGGGDKRVLDNLANYFVDEVQDKNEIEIDVSLWERERVRDLPCQENGFDCGVFMIKYTDFYSRGLKLCFDQSHMPYFRQRTVLEILRKRAD